MTNSSKRSVRPFLERCLGRRPPGTLNKQNMWYKHKNSRDLVDSELLLWPEACMHPQHWVIATIPRTVRDKEAGIIVQQTYAVHWDPEPNPPYSCPATLTPGCLGDLLWLIGHRRRLGVCVHTRIYSFRVIPLGAPAPLPEKRLWSRRIPCGGMQGTLTEFPGEKGHLSYPHHHHIGQKDNPVSPHTLENKLLYVAKFWDYHAAAGHETLHSVLPFGQRAHYLWVITDEGRIDARHLQELPDKLKEKAEHS